MHKVIGGLRQQASSACRCPSCSIPATIARRVGTIAPRPNRATLLTSTTIVCSGIATAAAFVDADQKTTRRKQWDKAISDLREDVAAVKTRNEQFLLEQFDADTIVDPDKKWLDLVTDLLPMPATARIDTYRLAWNSVYDGTQQAQLDNVWTEKKIAIINLATMNMKLNLLKLIKLNVHDQALLDNIIANLEAAAHAREGRPHRDKAEVKIWKSSAVRWLREPLQRYHIRAADLKKSLGRVWKADHNLVESTENDDSNLKVHTRRRPSESEAVKLNSQLRGLFANVEADEASRWLCLAAAVDTLGAYATTPNLKTYNILLAGLEKLGIPHSFNIAIRALRQCNLQPNEATLSLALQHYIRLNDRHGFERWLGYIDGECGGLSVMHPNNSKIDFDSKPYLRRGLNGRLVHKATPTPMVFSAIIAGKLHFDGLAEALQTCKKMGQEGWRLDLDGFGPLLRHCASIKDKTTGEELWKVVQQMQERAQRRLARNQRLANADVSIPNQVYIAMLALLNDEQPTGPHCKVEQLTNPARRSTADNTPETDRLAAPSLPASQNILAGSFRDLKREATVIDIPEPEIDVSSAIDDLPRDADHAGLRQDHSIKHDDGFDALLQASTSQSGTVTQRRRLARSRSWSLSTQPDPVGLQMLPFADSQQQSQPPVMSFAC